jgi:lipid-A-disaccharide synthase
MTAVAAPLKIFLIAGEPSGDVLGAALMRSLRELAETDVDFIGVGGPQMIAEGLKTLFSIDEIAVMGLVEVIPRISKILKLIEKTANSAIIADPAIVVTIDCPDFSKRVLKKIRAYEPAIPLVHYVAPSVWAWRAGRAKKLAGLIDHLLALLPFEPPYFEKHGLKITFIGHPVVENSIVSLKDSALFREGLRVNPDQIVLALLPGSRKGEVTRHLPIFYDILKHFQTHQPDFKVFLPVAEPVADIVSDTVKDWPFDISIIDPRHSKTYAESQKRKYQALASANVALCVSGTVSLEIAACGTPMVVVYKTNPITAYIVKKLIKIKTATLVNLILERNVVPEYFQEQIIPAVISKKLHLLISNQKEREDQRSAFLIAMKKLGRQPDQPTPSQKAARVILDRSRWKKDYYEEASLEEDVLDETPALPEMKAKQGVKTYRFSSET